GFCSRRMATPPSTRSIRTRGSVSSAMVGTLVFRTFQDPIGSRPRIEAPGHHIGLELLPPRLAEHPLDLGAQPLLHDQGQLVAQALAPALIERPGALQVTPVTEHG